MIILFVIKEFKEGRNHSQTAPKVLFSEYPPTELEGTDVARGDNIGYITFGKWYLRFRVDETKSYVLIFISFYFFFFLQFSRNVTPM